MTGSAHQGFSENGCHHGEDMQDTYRRVKAMTFVSEDAAYDFYNKYARDRGFSIRREKVKRL